MQGGNVSNFILFLINNKIHLKMSLIYDEGLQCKHNQIYNSTCTYRDLVWLILHRRLLNRMHHFGFRIMLKFKNMAIKHPVLRLSQKLRFFCCVVLLVLYWYRHICHRKWFTGSDVERAYCPYFIIWCVNFLICSRNFMMML